MRSVTDGKRPSRKYESLLLGIVAGVLAFVSLRVAWAQAAGQQPEVHPMLGFYFVPLITAALFVLAAVCEAVIAWVFSQPIRHWTHHAIIGFSWSTPAALIVQPALGVVTVLVINPLTVRYILRKVVSGADTTKVS